MIVQEIKLWNFRKFKAAGEAPGLRVEFHNGLNAIVGGERRREERHP